MSLNITNGNTVSLLRKSVAGTIDNEQMNTLKYSTKMSTLGKKFNKTNYQVEYELPDENEAIITKGHYSPQPAVEHKNQIQLVESAERREEENKQREEESEDEDSDSEDEDECDNNINIIINSGINSTLVIVFCMFSLILVFLINKGGNKQEIIGSNETNTEKKIITYTYEVDGGNTNIMGHKPKSYIIKKK